MEIIKEFILPDDEISGTLVIREACRAIIFDENNMMPLLFVATENYHKLPGWWVEIGEDKIMALTRELQEETWCEAEITKEIGIIIESNSTRKQISYCYMGNVTKKTATNFTKEEKEKWFEVQWATIDEAIKIIEEDKMITRKWKNLQKRELYTLKKAKELM